MLSVYFGYDQDSIRDIDLYFDNVYDDRWLEDEFVKQMIKDVDGSEVVSPACIESPVLGQIPPEKLSGGVKALVVLYEMEDAYIDLIVCGPNCEKWLSQISEKKDNHVSMSGFDLKFENVPISGKCLNDGATINGSREWLLKMDEFAGE